MANEMYNVHAKNLNFQRLALEAQAKVLRDKVDQRTKEFLDDANDDVRRAANHPFSDDNYHAQRYVAETESNRREAEAVLDKLETSAAQLADASSKYDRAYTLSQADSPDQQSIAELVAAADALVATIPDPAAAEKDPAITRILDYHPMTSDDFLEHGATSSPIDELPSASDVADVVLDGVDSATRTAERVLDVVDGTDNEPPESTEPNVYRMFAASLEVQSAAMQSKATDARQRVDQHTADRMRDLRAEEARLERLEGAALGTAKANDLLVVGSEARLSGAKRDVTALQRQLSAAEQEFDRAAIDNARTALADATSQVARETQLVDELRVHVQISKAEVALYHQQRIEVGAKVVDLETQRRYAEGALDDMDRQVRLLDDARRHYEKAFELSTADQPDTKWINEIVRDAEKFASEAGQPGVDQTSYDAVDQLVTPVKVENVEPVDTSPADDDEPLFLPSEPANPLGTSDLDGMNDDALSYLPDDTFAAPDPLENLGTYESYDAEPDFLG